MWPLWMKKGSILPLVPWYFWNHRRLNSNIWPNGNRSSLERKNTACSVLTVAHCGFELNHLLNSAYNFEVKRTKTIDRIANLTPIFKPNHFHLLFPHWAVSLTSLRLFLLKTLSWFLSLSQRESQEYQSEWYLWSRVLKMPLYFTSLRISFNSPSDLINAKVLSLKKKEKRKHKFKACQLRKKRHGTIVKPKQSACSNHLIISTSFVSTNYSPNYPSKIRKLFGRK